MTCFGAHPSPTRHGGSQNGRVFIDCIIPIVAIKQVYNVLKTLKVALPELISTDNYNLSLIFNLLPGTNFASIFARP